MEKLSTRGARRKLQLGAQKSKSKPNNSQESNIGSETKDPPAADQATMDKLIVKMREFERQQIKQGNTMLAMDWKLQRLISQLDQLPTIIKMELEEHSEDEESLDDDSQATVAYAQAGRMDIPLTLDMAAPDMATSMPMDMAPVTLEATAKALQKAKLAHSKMKALNWAQAQASKK